MASVWGTGGAMGLLSGGEPKSLYDSLPDPMKPDLVALGVTVLLVITLILVLRSVLFQPLLALLHQRDHDVNAGADTKAKAAALVEERQADYAAKLKELRAQAFAHRKALAEAAAKEKQALVDDARAKAGAQRSEALAALRTQQEAAKAELMGQVDALADAMVSHLLQQA